jgi:hypothetical protein
LKAPTVSSPVNLAAIHINGADLILLLTNLTIEIVNSMAPSGTEADHRLIELANGIEAFARDVSEPRARLLLTGLARGLMATESPA